ncbi:LysR family transcriptional regulator [uncultured Paraglaciecola sp.]|uniref:LysR family transcriptional regulator n=1 Tax=uncultured Paraglaciecola sp. TaxID=1765024 RepID=UPI0030DD9C9A|tara:strand:+ start:1519 stop:2394 length:876 start_codon:yes stop_codon:yes gene_type:complete
MRIWEGVSEFVAVAETHSFTAASKQLGTSVAHISRQVSALETRLKIKLFHRSTRKVVLSESGEVYYQQCRRVLDNLADAEKLVSNFHDTPKGNVRLTAPITYGEEVIMPIVNEFLLAYPEINVRVDLSNQRADLLYEGYDFAIRLGHLADSNLIARKLSARKLIACATPDYLTLHGEPINLDDLSQHNCLVGTADSWRFMHNNKSEKILISGRLRCNSGHSLVKAALKNIGLIQLPDYYVQPYIETGELIPVLDNYQMTEEGIWALYPDKHYLPNKIKVLLDFIQQHLKDK